MNEQERVIGAFFDQCANEGYMAEFNAGERARLAVFLGRWDIRPGDRIFEPGCGSGRLTEILAELTGENGLVTACYVSKEMVALAVKRKMPPHVRVYHASIESVPVDPGSFDRVICFQVFPHFIDRPGALDFMHRALKPGGKLWINHLASRTEINHLHQNARGVVVSHMIPEESEMRGLLVEHGFRVLSLLDSEEGYSLEALRP
jgi:demethylmenaquinone methyltransferase/2-methoxy-6-polyprenyl-1,4-benzoquinol methylase